MLKTTLGFRGFLLTATLTSTLVPALAAAAAAPAAQPRENATIIRAVEFFADFEYAKNTNFTRSAPVTATEKPPVGSGRGWGWEAAFTHSQNTLGRTIDNVISNTNRELAVAGGLNAAGVPTTGGAYSIVHAGFSPTGALILVPSRNPVATTAGQSAAGGGGRDGVARGEQHRYRPLWRDRQAAIRVGSGTVLTR